MANFGDTLENWFKEVKSACSLTVEEREQITYAGAEKYKEHLEQVTREKHYSSHHDNKHGHMADSVLIKKGTIDNNQTGSSIVGFGPYHAENARRLNDGTIHIKGDNFVDYALEESREAIFEAEQAEYKKIMSEKGGI